MTHPYDHIGGYQHHRDHRRLDPHVRDVIGGRRSDIKPEDEESRPWAADDINWAWWAPIEDRREIGGWSMAWPAIVTAAGLLPLRGDGEPDDRFTPLQEGYAPGGSGKDPAPPTGFQPCGPAPPGTCGIMVAATEETEQRNLFFPTGGALFAHHRTPPGPPELSTQVFDNTAAPDALSAGLHTAWWVKPLDDDNVQLALNLTTSEGDATGWGYTIAEGDGSPGPVDPNGTAPAPPPGGPAKVLSRLSWETPAGQNFNHGGPYHPGHAYADRHRDGTTPEGNPKQPGHIDIHALFYKNRVEDGEKEHTTFEQGVDFPVVTKTYEGWDEAQKLHRRWTTSPVIPEPLYPFPGDGIRITPDPGPGRVTGGGSGDGNNVTGGGTGENEAQRADTGSGHERFVDATEFLRRFTDQMHNPHGTGGENPKGPTTIPGPGDSLNPEEITIGASRTEREFSAASFHVTQSRDKNQQEYDNRYGGAWWLSDTEGQAIDANGDPISLDRADPSHPDNYGATADPDNLDASGLDLDLEQEGLLPPATETEEAAAAERANRQRKNQAHLGTRTDEQREQIRRERDKLREQRNANAELWPGEGVETFEETGHDRLGLDSGDAKFEGVPPQNLSSSAYSLLAPVIPPAAASPGRVEGRFGRVSEAARRRGGPFPYSLHIGAVGKVVDGKNQYKSEPGVHWDNGTAEQACAFLYPGGWLPDGPTDQTAWVGSIDYAFHPSGKLGLGVPDVEDGTGTFRDGPYVTTTGNSGSRDAFFGALDADGNAREATFDFGSVSNPQSLCVYGTTCIERDLRSTPAGFDTSLSSTVTLTNTSKLFQFGGSSDGGTGQLNLPGASGLVDGLTYIIVNTGSDVLNVSGNGKNINGSGTASLVQYARCGVTYDSDAGEWTRWLA